MAEKSNVGWNSKSIEELKLYIKQGTQQINAMKKPKDKVGKDFYNRLKIASGTSKKSSRLAMHLTKKRTKEELVYQARMINKYLDKNFDKKFDTLNNKAEQSRMSYNRNHPDNPLSREEYDFVTEVLGALEGKLKEHEMSTSIVETIVEQKEELKDTNLVKTIQDAQKETEGQHMNSLEVTNHIIDKILEQIK